MLSGIIEARMKEILELVHFEIVRSGYERKLIGGIVLTGGGAQLKHIKQLVEYITGLDCRIGKPIEHVINYTDESQLPPALSTGVGLVITGEENVGEDFIERTAAEAQLEDFAMPVSEDTEESFAVTEDFLSFMTSELKSEETSTEEEVVAARNEESTPSDVQNEQEEIVKQQEVEAPIRGTRKTFGESMLGRFKGFFENDEAMN